MSKKFKQKGKVKWKPKAPPAPNAATVTTYKWFQFGMKIYKPLDAFGRMIFLPQIRFGIVSVLLIDHIIIYLASHGVLLLAPLANEIKPIFYFIKTFPYDLIFHVILWFGYFNDVVTNEERLNNAGKVSKGEQKKLFYIGMFKASLLLAFAFNFQNIIRYEILFFSVMNFIMTFTAFKAIEKMTKKHGNFDFNKLMDDHLKSE
ncbi:hypothetical protein [Paenibacillus sp. A3M_27_13]|uniref:hypothetical protein n=1 Tax=Paenibacillus sp. A3M_27_13 TaxID=2962029 RepID=UPI0020B7C15D|nr:hypothetical protein [Paenibacillus sp. A3M_27_13]MCP3746773.1 hypothetical protein [Paenibacillus sp. A3M_27_13]